MQNATCNVDKQNLEVNWISMVGACIQGVYYLLQYALLLVSIKTNDTRIKEAISNGIIIINTTSAVVGILVVMILFEKHIVFVCTSFMISIGFHLLVVCF